MVQSSSRKKKLTIVLVIALTAMIFCGVGLGVYFFIKGKESGSGLSKNQIAFGTAIQSQNVDPVLTKKDFSFVYDGSVQNVICFSNDFLAVSDDGEISFVSLEQNQSFVLDIDFDEIVSIFGKVAHLKKGGTSILVDLANKKVIAEFSSSTIFASGNFVLLKAQKNGTFTHFADEQDKDVSVLILNTKTLETVFEFTLDDDLVDVFFDDDLAFVISLQKSQVFSLSQNFEKVLELENIGEKNLIKSNLQSSISSDSFFMSTYHVLSRLSSSAILVEKTTITNQDDCSIVISKDGEDFCYKLEYNIFNAKTNSFALLSSGDCVIKAESCEFADSYVAVVRSEILNKNTISQNQTIEYLFIDSTQLSKNTFKVEKLVSYDFTKFGKIVGYEKGTLLTKGGTMSGVIDFSGNSLSCIRSSAGESAESVSWKNSAIIFSSITGMKGVKTSNGDVIFDAVYEKISPIDGKNMIAKMGTKFYVLDTDKGVSEINNFATEFEDYVFSGLGMFFTKTEDGKYNVYKTDKTVYKLSQKVKILENQNSHMLCIGDDEIFELELANGLNSKKLTIQKSMSTLVTDLRTFSGSAQTVATGESLGGSSDVAEAVGVGFGEGEGFSLDVDSNTGGGFATINKKFEDIGNSKSDLFTSYSSLTDEQKSLIPVFDNKSSNVYEVNNVEYLFDGVYFESNSLVTVAYIRIKNRTSSNSNYLLMVNIAFKNAYLKSATLTSSEDGDTWSNFAWNDNGTKSTQPFSSDFTVSPQKLPSGVVFTNEENVSLTRIVDYVSLGFDGGMVFVSSEANYFNIEFEISNIFVANNLTTGALSLDDGEKEFDFFKVIVKEKQVQLVANDGYAFTWSDFFALSTNSIVDADENNVSTLSEYARNVVVDYSENSESYFSISNIKMVEQYSKLTLKDFEGSEAKSQTVYYFYGYSDQTSSERNPAPLGFENFERRTEVQVYTRDGYTFNGFFAPNSDELVAIDSEGHFIGNSEMFSTDNAKMNEFELKAKYTAKQYTICYSVDGTKLETTTTVTFDSPIGDGLLTEAAVPSGYEFKGWLYKDNEITKETIYTYSENITLEANVVAKHYTVNFDLNLSTYQNVNINGFEYAITTAKFVNDWESFHVGDEATSTSSMSKDITFGQPFGILPNLVGVDLEQKTYSFVCWSNQANPSQDDGTLNYGDVYISETEVDSTTIDPKTEDITLYAHFIKKTYQINVVDKNNNDVVVKDGTTISHLEKIRVEGASSEGVKTKFSTATEDGYSSLSKTDDTFQTHTVQDESYVLNLYAGEGYYVSKIVVKNKNGTEIVTYTIPQEGTPSIVGDSSNPTLIINDSENCVSVSFDKFLESYDKATIEVQTSPIVFENTFDVTGVDNVKKGEIVVTDNKDEGLIYASSRTYEITTLSSYVLKSVKLADKTITFEVQAKINQNYFYNVLVADNNYLSQNSNAGVITTVYGLSANAKLKTCYNVSAKVYSYFIETTQYENNVFEFVAEEVKANVKVSFENASEEDDREVGMTAEGSLNGEALTENISSVYEKTISRDDSLVLTLTLKDFYLIYGNITVSYGNGTANNILKFTNTTDYDEMTITQTAGVVAPISYWTKEAQGATMNGTGISVSVDEDSKVFTFTINKAYKDVEIKLSYQKYRFVQVEAKKSSSFTLSVLEETKSVQTLTSPETTNKDGSDYKLFSYIIYQNETSIKSLKLETKNTDEAFFKVTNSSGCELDELNMKAEIKFQDESSNEINVAFMRVEEVQRDLKISSWFCSGVDGENWTYSKYSGTKLDGYQTDLSKVLKITYYEDEQEKSAYYGGSDFKFSGKIFSIQVEGCFVVESAVLKKEDKNSFSGTVSGMTYSYNLSITEGLGFEFEIKIRPKTFNVSFELEGNLEDKNPSSQISNTEELEPLSGNLIAFFGVDFVIPNVEPERTGYIFRGYSLSTDGVSKYEKNGTGNIVVSDNFDVAEDEMTDVTVKILYSVWESKEYNIQYNTNDSESGKGSTKAEEKTMGSTVKFDEQFELSEFSRLGYDLDGWYATNEKNAENLVKNGTVLDLGLLNKLTTDNFGSLILNAIWTAKEFTVSFDVNTDDNGSTKITGESPTDVKVMFDKANGLTLPSLTRTGYDFLGFSASALQSDDVDKSASFWKDNATVDKDFLDACQYNEIDDSLKLTIFAVWKAQTVKAYINTKESELAGRSDNDPDLTLKVTDANGSKEGGYYIEVTFDKTFEKLPTITAVGYKFIGLFPAGKTETADKITSPILGLGGTKVDKTFIENYYKDFLETEYSGALGDFTIDACYEIEKYVHEEKKEDNITLEGEPEKEFYEDLNLTFTADSDFYIYEIKISGEGEEITLKFEWKKAEMKAEFKSISSSKNEINDISQRTSLYKEIETCEVEMQKVTESGVGVYKVVVNLKIKNAKKELTISATPLGKTIDVTFWIYAQGNNEQTKYNQSYLTKEYTLSSGKVWLYQNEFLENVDYPFLKGYEFENYCLGTVSDGEVSLIGEVIPEEQSNSSFTKINTNVVAYYKDSTRQGVHFFFYDTAQGEYVERDDVNEYMVCWKDGSDWKNNSSKFDLKPFNVDGTINKLAGKVKDLPSVGSLLWPGSTKTILCGFVISDSAPASDYFSKNCGKTDFDCSTKIEKEINVYAVYDEQYFQIKSVSVGENLQSECNLYYQDIDGIFKKFEGEVKYFKLDEKQLENFNSRVEEGNTREVALKYLNLTSSAEATCRENGFNYVAVVLGTNGSYYCVSENILEA